MPTTPLNLRFCARPYNYFSHVMAQLALLKLALASSLAGLKASLLAASCGSTVCCWVQFKLVANNYLAALSIANASIIDQACH